MVVLKTAGKIIGAKLSNAERTALLIEIKKELAEHNRKNVNELDAIVLWFLHEEFGFGLDRLKKAHQAFVPRLQELCDRYEMTDDGDTAWLCTHKLKEYGCDIEEWNKEVN